MNILLLFGLDVLYVCFLFCILFLFFCLLEGGGGALGLLGGGVGGLFNTAGNLLTHGLLNVLKTGAIAGGQREVESLGAAAAGGLGNVGGLAELVNTFHAVLGAGETVMQTFPVAELVKTGYELSNSGILQRQTRRGKKNAAAPPIGGKRLTDGVILCAYSPF